MANWSDYININGLTWGENIFLDDPVCDSDYDPCCVCGGEVINETVKTFSDEKYKNYKGDLSITFCKKCGELHDREFLNYRLELLDDPISMKFYSLYNEIYDDE